MDDVRDLTVILKSRFPIVLIESHEESRVRAMLERVSNLEGMAIFTWTVTGGLNRAHDRGAIPNTADLTAALRWIDKSPNNGLYVLCDAHPFLDDPVNVRAIREIAQAYDKTARTLIFVSPRLDLPEELMRHSARFSLRMPDAEAIWKLLLEEIGQYEGTPNLERPYTDPEAVKALARHLQGLCLEDARRQVRDALNRDGMITRDDLQYVTRFKQTAFGAESTLSLELDTGSFAEVGGLNGLKRWLAVRRKAFLGDAGQFGLDRPKGVMLLGVQGGGKSLAAKAVAGAWGLPLLRLDFATLYNKFFGETERNLREALKAAEGMAPCVLWIDEIEKGVATDNASGVDGGVSRRVLGTLLTWLAERQTQVFIVATANDIQSLPPELLRKGRLDEIFFVDLPDAAARRDIFEIHLNQRKQDPAKFNLDLLAKMAIDFSGAEIEQAIVSALYEAFAEDKPLDTPMILAEIKRTRPLAVVMAEKVEALRAWARERTVPAD